MALSSRNLKQLTELSLIKNLMPLSELPPDDKIVTWDVYKKVQRHLEIWNNPKSIVHRLPKHYQEHFWKNLLSSPMPVHYRPPKHRFYWDKKRNIELEAEKYPILPEYCPEQDQGLWGGEGVVKGYIESRPYTKKKILPRNWVPHLWFPAIKTAVLYSEVLDKHILLKVTERTMRLIDDCCGIDSYLLETPNVDINSRLGISLKRLILIKLARANYYEDDLEKKDYIGKKYKKFVLSLEEAEWYGLDLNQACRKLQDLEDGIRHEPLKYRYEDEMVNQLHNKLSQNSYLSTSNSPPKSTISSMLKSYIFQK